MFGPPSAFIFTTDEAVVELKLRYRPEINAQLDGFRGYVWQLPNTDAARHAAIDRIQKVQAEIGVQLSQPIAIAGDTFAALKAFAFAHGGFVFVQDSVLTETGYIVGPASHSGAFMQPAASVHVDLPDYAANASPRARAIRAATMERLREAGFRPAANLPFSDDAPQLRPKEEIAGRFCALLNLFMLVAAPEDVAPEQPIRKLIAAHDLKRFLTPDEAAILALSRADAHRQHVDSIGWRLENMLPLAWAIGMEPPPSIDGAMAGGDERDQMIALLPPRTMPWQAFVDQLSLRSAEDIQALEDLFYCAHNAVRSGQLGHPTVPESFHAVGNGGVIHERRHALTWMLSPDADWDETDLST